MGTKKQKPGSPLGDWLFTVSGVLVLAGCVGYLGYDFSEYWWPTVTGQVVSLDQIGKSKFGNLYKLTYDYKFLNIKYEKSAVTEVMPSVQDQTVRVIYNPLSAADSKVLSVNAHDLKRTFLLLMFGFFAAVVIFVGARSLGSRAKHEP